MPLRKNPIKVPIFLNHSPTGGATINVCTTKIIIADPLCLPGGWNFVEMFFKPRGTFPQSFSPREAIGGKLWPWQKYYYYYYFYLRGVWWFDTFIEKSVPHVQPIQNFILRHPAQIIGQKIEIKTLQGMFQFSMGVGTLISIDLYGDSHWNLGGF